MSVLPTVSNVFERLINKQITNYIEPCLSSILCSFRKGYNAQHALVRVLEKWKSSLDNGENIGAILMDLSKAFDCIRHDLLLQNSYGFSRESLCLIYSFLDNWHQRAKSNGPFSTYKRLYLGAPQASVLGPLFFNIYINDLLLSLETDFCNYADESTIYACDKTLDSVVARLESDSSIVIQWPGGNFMKLNADKCHLLILERNSNEQVTLNIGDSLMENTDEEKLLGVVIDKKLTFDTHISKLCKKAGSKLFALARIAGHMDTNKLRVLMRPFVISHYQYWMFHSRHLNNKIDRIHERALRIAYRDYQSNFNVLLENDCSVSMHVENLQTLMIEIFETKQNLNPPSMKEIFCERSVVHNL